MILKIIGLVAAALSGAPALINTEPKTRRRPGSDDPVLDAYRLRQERLRAPSWYDQRMALRNVNGYGRWL
jgi:hypothetical protein